MAESRLKINLSGAIRTPDFTLTSPKTLDARASRAGSRIPSSRAQDGRHPALRAQGYGISGPCAPQCRLTIDRGEDFCWCQCKPYGVQVVFASDPFAQPLETYRSCRGAFCTKRSRCTHVQLERAHRRREETLQQTRMPSLADQRRRPSAIPAFGVNPVRSRRFPAGPLKVFGGGPRWA